MRRLLIVEDEAIVRGWLVRTMRWDALGFEVAGAAENGLDALRFLKRQAVDAVITDIRMPDMDGLEMMAMLKAQRPDLPVIILSGYNSFEHARKALQLGAFEFLSKPLDEEELCEVMARLEGHLKARDREEAAAQTLRRALATALFGQELSDPERRQILGQLLPGMTVDSACVAVMAVDTEASQDAVRQALREAGVFRHSNLAVTYRDGRFYLLICAATPLRYDAFMTLARNVYCATEDALRARLEGVRADITLVLGGLMQDLSTLPSWTRTAEEALEATFFQGRGEMLEAARLLAAVRRPAPAEETLRRLNAQAQDAIESCVRGQAAQAQNACAAVLALLPECFGGDAAQCRFQILEWLILLEARGREQGLDPSGEDGKLSLYRDLFDCHTLSQVAALVRDKGGRMAKRIERLRAEREQTISRKAIAYIRANLSQKLTLEDIAGALFLNPAYLSSTFKRETGLAMTRFINRERVELAKDLLSRQQLSTQEVSDRLGFGTYRYFCSVFKRETGRTPGDYRSRPH